MIPVVLLLCSFFLSFCLGLLLIPNILLISHKKHLYDLPDRRKIHKGQIPQLGGTSFFPAILISICLSIAISTKLGVLPKDPLYENTLVEFLFLMTGSMFLFLIGIADDLIGISYSYKFLVQLIAACLLVFAGDWFNNIGGLFGYCAIPSYVGIPLTIVFIIYVVNAINLIDGIDGLASGLCIISLSTLGLMYFILRHYVYAALAFATLGVLIPFWFYNVFGNEQKGHKLFMGDTGSLLLGYILGFLVLRLGIAVPTGEFHSRQLVMAVSPLIIPLFDVVRVVIFRLRHGKNPFLPDNNHFHHKLLRSGMGPHTVLFFILVVCIFFLGVNYVLVDKMTVAWLLLLDIVLWVLMHLILDMFVHRGKK